MENLTQQQIEELIQFIDDAESPATITNTIVAAVLAFLAAKIAGTATAQALLNEIAARQIADSNLSTSIDQLQQLIQSMGFVVYLDSMGELDGDVDVHVDTGMVVYDPGNDIIKKYASPSQYESVSCDAKLLYCNKVTGYFYRHSTKSGMMQVGGGGGESALSLINQIISNIDLVNGRINTLIDDLAGLAFTGAKTAKTELDWDGTKVTVSLNTSGLSGCRVQETFPKQVLEGSSATITIVPTNDSHLLRNASYKIGANGEAHDVAISGNKAVINLSRINENITVYLTASATAKGSFTASISDSRVSGTGATSGIAEGSAWLSQLSLNNTAEEGASITSITATMEGGGTINVSGNIVSTNYVTGNIHITATVAVVGRVSLSFPALSSGVKITDNNNNNAVVNDGVSTLTLIENSSISWKIGAIEGYRLSGVPSIQVESGQAAHSIVPTDNGDGTYSLNINSMTGYIAIIATATEIIVRHVTNRLLNMTSSNSDTSIEQGEGYSTQLSVDSGCKANGDVRVKIGNSYAFNEYDVSQGNTNTSGITYENGLLTIPAAAITGDIEIIATAYIGVVKITTTGATTLRYAGGTTYNLDEGLNEITFNNKWKGWFKIDDESLVTAIDFGGIMFTETYNRTLSGFTNLTSVQNLVVGGGANSISGWFNNTSSLSAVDISLWDVSKVTSIANLFTGSAIQRVDMSMLVFENAVSLSSAFQNTTSLTYIDISSIENVSDVNRMFSYNKDTSPQCDVYIGDFNASSISGATNVFLFANVNLHCLSSTPPLIGNTNWLTSGAGLKHIYVPDEAAVTAYSGATGWSAKASIIAVEPTNN